MGAQGFLREMAMFIGKTRLVLGVAKTALEASVGLFEADRGEVWTRMNAISTGAIKTLVASGISQFRRIWTAFAERIPFKRNVTPTDVATSGLCLFDRLEREVAGEILYVDCGLIVMGS